MWGNRVVIPEKLRRDVMEMLHTTHAGVVTMKNMARRYLWWAGLDKDIEDRCKTCADCQINQNMPRRAESHPWDIPDGPWQRVHIDFATFKGSQWLVVVDAYSKWVEVVKMYQDTTARNLIVKMRNIFAQFGLADVVVSDNGPQLSRSKEFVEFLKSNGVRYVPIPSYHPASNGLAEVMVGKFKGAMKKMLSAAGGDIDSHLAKWLFTYRNTPHPTTGEEPAFRMFGRRPKTLLSLLNPLANRSKDQQKYEKKRELARMNPGRILQVGDTVLYRNVLKGLWLEGIVKAVKGVVVVIQTSDGSVTEKHLDHVTKFHNSSTRFEQDLNPSLGLSQQNDAFEIPRAEFDQSTDMIEPSSRANSGQSSQDLPLSVNNEIRPRRTCNAPERLNYSKPGG